MGAIRHLVWIVSIVLILLVDCCGADHAEQAGPAILFEQEVLTADGIVEGQDVVHTFVFSNPGNAALHIRKVRPDCGCTTVQFDRTVAAGGMGKITVSVDTTGSWGEVVRRTAVFSNDPKTPVKHLEMRLRITPVISIEPTRVTMRGFPEETLSKEIVIRSNIERPLELREKELTVPGRISHRILPIEEKHSYAITFENQVKEPAVYRGRLILETNFPERPVLVIPIFCRILDDIEVTPGAVDFGRVQKDCFLETRKDKAGTNKRFLENLPALKKDIFVSGNRNDTFKISRTAIDTRYFRTDIKEFPGGNRYRITLVALVEKMGKERIDTLLKIYTNSPSHPVIDVPVRIVMQ
jgi:hypothetical protein